MWVQPASSLVLIAHSCSNATLKLLTSHSALNEMVPHGPFGQKQTIQRTASENCKYVIMLVVGKKHHTSDIYPYSVDFTGLFPFTKFKILPRLPSRLCCASSPGAGLSRRFTAARIRAGQGGRSFFLNRPFPVLFKGLPDAYGCVFSRILWIR